MKHILFLMVLIALLSLGGCHLGADALFGNDSPDKDVELVSSGDLYNLCQEKKVEVNSVQNADGCDTPADLAAVLKRIDTGGTGSETLRIDFGKMRDGTFPKIKSILYRPSKIQHRNYTPRELSCKIVDSVASLRSYECKLEGLPEFDKNLKFHFDSLDLGHDSCNANARYQAAFHYPECGYPARTLDNLNGTYFNRQEIPSLYPTIVAKP